MKIILMQPSGVHHTMFDFRKEPEDNPQTIESCIREVNKLFQVITQGFGFKKFKPLNLFRQGYEDKQWILLESWSKNEDLQLEFVDFLSKKLDLIVEIE